MQSNRENRIKTLVINKCTSVDWSLIRPIHSFTTHILTLFFAIRIELHPIRTNTLILAVTYMEFRDWWSILRNFIPIKHYRTIVQLRLNFLFAWWWWFLVSSTGILFAQVQTHSTVYGSIFPVQALFSKQCSIVERSIGKIACRCMPFSFHQLGINHFP